MIIFTELPRELISAVFERFESYNDVLSLAKTCRQLYAVLDAPGQRFRCMRRSLRTRPRIETELWLNFFLSVNAARQEDWAIRTQLLNEDDWDALKVLDEDEPSFFMSLGLELVSIFADFRTKSCDEPPTAALSYIPEVGEEVLREVFRMSDDDVWMILARQQSLKILFDQFKRWNSQFQASKLPHPHASHTPVGILEARDFLPIHDASTESECSSQAVTGSEEEQRFHDALVERWLQLEVVRSASHGPLWGHHHRSSELPMRLLLWKQQRDCPQFSLLDAASQLEVYDFVYGFFVPKLVASEDNLPTGAPPAPLVADPHLDEVLSWTDKADNWRFLGFMEGPCMSPADVVNLYRLRLTQPLGASVSYQFAEMLLIKEVFLSARSVIGRGNVEMTFQAKVAAYLKESRRDLTSHTAGHYRAAWAELARGRILGTVTSDEQMLECLREFAKTTDTGESNALHPTNRGTGMAYMSELDYPPQADFVEMYEYGLLHHGEPLVDEY